MRSAVRWLPWPRDRCPAGRGCWSWAEEPLTVAAAEQEGEAAQASRSWRDPCLACVRTALNSRCPVPPAARSACRAGRSVSEGSRHLSASAGPPIRSGIEKRLGMAGSSLSVEGRHDTEPLSVKKGSPRMAGKNAKAESGGFSAEERAAMKERAAELRAEGKKGARKADGLQAVLGRIAEMAPEESCARRAGACDGDRDRPRVVAEDLVRDARLHERGRQGRRLLSGRGQVQLPVLDPGLPGRGEPRRRRHVAGVVRPPRVEPRGREKGHRAGEGRHLLTVAATAAARAALGTAVMWS